MIIIVLKRLIAVRVVDWTISKSGPVPERCSVKFKAFSV